MSELKGSLGPRAGIPSILPKTVEPLAVIEQDRSRNQKTPKIKPFRESSDDRIVTAEDGVHVEAEDSWFSYKR